MLFVSGSGSPLLKAHGEVQDQVHYKTSVHDVLPAVLKIDHSLRVAERRCTKLLIMSQIM